MNTRHEVSLLEIFNEFETLSDSEFTYSVTCIVNHKLTKQSITIKKETSFVSFPNTLNLISAFSQIIWGITHYSPIFSKSRIEKIIKRIMTCSEYTFDGNIFSSLPLRINGKNYFKFNNTTILSFNDITSCFAQAIHSHGNMQIDKFVAEKLLNSNNKAMQGFCELLKMMPQNLYMSEIFGHYTSRYSIESYKNIWSKNKLLYDKLNKNIADYEKKNDELKKRNLELSEQVNSIIRDRDYREKKTEQYISDLKERNLRSEEYINSLNYSISKKRRMKSPSENYEESLSERNHSQPLHHSFSYPQPQLISHQYAPQQGYHNISTPLPQANYNYQIPQQQIVYAPQPPQQMPQIYSTQPQQQIIYSANPESQIQQQSLLLRPSQQDPRLANRAQQIIPQPSSVTFSPVYQ